MARKNRVLPFVVQPRLRPINETIGSDLSGTIVIERRGYLSVAEKAWTQAFEFNDDSQNALYRLATEIGSDLSMSPTDAFRMITSGEASTDERLAPYTVRLLECVQAVGAAQERKKYVMATCLINSRIDPKWEVEDTMGLHPDILDGLAQLFEEEESQSVRALEAAYEKEEDEEDKENVELGKD